MSGNIGYMLLSKIVDENRVDVLRKYGIKRSTFATQGERKVYDYVIDYEKTNGDCPSYAAVADAVPEFDENYMPDVTDSFEWLASKIKKNEGKRRIESLVNDYLAENINKSDTEDIIEHLQSELESIRMGTRVRKKIGRTLADIKKDVLTEFYEREKGKSFTLWKTPFPTLNKAIGGLYSGDVYGVMAESGRGKTYLLVVLVDELLRQGANVLVKSFEVKEYSWIARLVSVITAREGIFENENVSEALGIPVRAILSGKMEDYVRDNFVGVMENIDKYYEGNLYFQGKSQRELTRTLNDLERELSEGDIDAVVLDPFYGLTDVYGRNANKTAGGAAEQAATRFEHICGDHNVVGIYTVQATVEKKAQDEEGARELKIPTRDQVKTSKRLLEIASILIGFDSVKRPDEVAGMAAIGIEKGRDGGEDLEIELVSMLDYGVLKEPDVTDQF
mgnify:CR=1 FL=1